MSFVASQNDLLTHWLDAVRVYSEGAVESALVWPRLSEAIKVIHVPEENHVEISQIRERVQNLSGNPQFFDPDLTKLVDCALSKIQK